MIHHKGSKDTEKSIFIFASSVFSNRVTVLQNVLVTGSYPQLFVDIVCLLKTNSNCRAFIVEIVTQLDAVDFGQNRQAATLGGRKGVTYFDG
ncbi:hypothetical protein [Endozoicomonas sp. SCSIO W0465]|uniref:hypothetical protein n=1 Tax=Endozoicomonas sp. SCSIO W0465 TaxID=2918516 RepID=UPI002074AED1|nr:hypothetical protein [Endozoicomonas sp. SCSIO W0465]USE35393.1 hypothetical protein MJO57_25355 [Endozoicomonas sp. SCSIO W0465]